MDALPLVPIEHLADCSAFGVSFNPAPIVTPTEHHRQNLTDNQQYNSDDNIVIPHHDSTAIKISGSPHNANTIASTAHIQTNDKTKLLSRVGMILSIPSVPPLLDLMVSMICLFIVILSRRWSVGTPAAILDWLRRRRIDDDNHNQRQHY